MPTPKMQVASNGTKSWKVRFRHGAINGSKTFGTKRAADIFCRDIDSRGVDYALRMLAEDTHTSPTLDELIDPFLEWKTQGPKKVRSDRSVADYQRDYRLWIEPWFGRVQAGYVTEDDVQAWVNDMLAGDPKTGRKPASAKSALDRHALLHAIYTWANRPPLRLGHDPCTSTALPKRRKGQPKGLRPAEWEALHSMLRQGSEGAADLAWFLLGSGWRWSEATALTTYDVEDDGTQLWVTMSQVVRRNAASEHVIVQDGKADASLRRIKLDPDAAAMVRRRVAAAPPGGLVFTTDISRQNGLGGSRWHYNNFMDRHWNPAVKAANLSRRPTLHWLRHTHVGWMVLAGASLPELQSRIGHASIQTTINVYGRMITDVNDDALDRFSAMRQVTPTGDAPAIESPSGP